MVYFLKGSKVQGIEDRPKTENRCKGKCTHTVCRQCQTGSQPQGVEMSKRKRCKSNCRSLTLSCQLLLYHTHTHTHLIPSRVQTYYKSIPTLTLYLTSKDYNTLRCHPFADTPAISTQACTHTQTHTHTPPSEGQVSRQCPVWVCRPQWKPHSMDTLSCLYSWRGSRARQCHCREAGCQRERKDQQWQHYTDGMTKYAHVKYLQKRWILV